MFTAAGKFYWNVKQLTHRQIGEYQSEWCFRPNPIYEDIHGRKVIALRERFPCFDTSDFLHEDRYYRWYYIKHDDGIALVYTVDGKIEVHVCNDIHRENASTCCIRPAHDQELRLAGFL